MMRRLGFNNEDQHELEDVEGSAKRMLWNGSGDDGGEQRAGKLHPYERRSGIERMTKRKSTKGPLEGQRLLVCKAARRMNGGATTLGSRESTCT